MSDPSIQSGLVSARLSLRGEYCIESLTERREQLLRALEDGLPVVLDLAGISRIDTAGLQLLLAFVSDMRAQACSVGWAEVPSVVTTAARLAGIGELLGLSNASAPAAVRKD